MGCVGSCLGSCAATCCCSACSKCLPSTSKGSLIPYVILSFIATLVAIILRYWGGPMLIHLYVYDLKLCDSDKCVGFGAVYRISFSLFVFYMIHALLMQLISSCAKIDRSPWLVKILLFAVLIVVSWFIPNEFYDVYVHIARIVAAIFLILQIVILIDFAYRWNESWTSEEKGYFKGILAVSFLLYAASLILLIFSYIWFTRDGTCHLQKFFVSFTLCGTFIATAISVSSIPAQHNRGGILPAAAVTLYCYWLLYSALQADPSTCNTLKSDDELQLAIGLVLGAAAISYAGWNLATCNTLFGKDPETQAAVERAQVQAENAKDDIENGRDGAPEEEVDDETAAIIARRNVKFHYVMAAAAMYMAMLLTNWGSRQEAETGVNGTHAAYDQTVENVWIRMATQWLTLLLFIWSLVAPSLFPNRDWS